MRELKQDWRDLFCAFRIALDLKKMVLGFVAVLVSILFLALLVAIGEKAGLLDYVTSRQVCDMLAKRPAEGWPALANLAGVVLSNGLDAREVVFICIAGLVLLFGWSILGGAISRAAAVEFARDERIDLHESITFSRKKLASYFFSPLVPLVALVFFMLCNNLGGVIGRIPHLGPILVGIGLPLALLSGFLMTLLAIGEIFGFPLMFPTISAEGTDAFDAISRAYSYIYSRPWRYIWYNLVALVYGAVVCCFVAVFTIAVLEFTLGTAHFGMGKNFAEVRMTVWHTLFGASAATGAIQVETGRAVRFCQMLSTVWIHLVVGLAAGFAVSLAVTLRTIIYFLMRKAVDGTDMTEVYLEEEEEDFTVAPAPAPAAATAPAAEDKAEEEPKPAAKKTTRKRKTRKKTAKKSTRKKAT